MLGCLQYLDYRKDLIIPSNMLNYINFKRRSFEHKRELRAVIWEREKKFSGDSVSNDRGETVGYIVPVVIQILLPRCWLVRIQTAFCSKWYRDCVIGMDSRFALPNLVLTHLRHIRTVPSGFLLAPIGGNHGACRASASSSTKPLPPVIQSACFRKDHSL